MFVRSVSSRVMISLHVTCFGVVVHLRPEAKMRLLPSYTVKIARITGMSRLTALILWMSFEFTLTDQLFVPYCRIML